MLVVAVPALALRPEGAVVEGEDVALGTGALVVQLEALTGGLVVVHALGEGKGSQSCVLQFAV